MSKVFYNKRKAEELGFHSFSLFVVNNHFDVIADKAISAHEKTLKKLNSKVQKNIDDDAFWDILFVEDELKTMSEMKIIYAYKHFETCLKFMLKATYKVNSSKFFQWEAVKEFLSTKSIPFASVDGYTEINELREINNAIKHSIISESRIIPKEFKGKSVISYLDILEFYKRIEESTPIFFKCLYTLIEKDLYEFSSERLDKMATEVEENMSPEKATELAQNILARYK